MASIGTAAMKASGVDGNLLSYADISKIKLLNDERSTCNIHGQGVDKCKYYCCGEFWESKAKFCCKNNFKPTRSLFLYLLVAFAALFCTIVVYLYIEKTIKDSISEQVSMIQTNLSTTALKDDEIESDGSQEEDSLSEETVVYPTKWQDKHSQNFKYVSRITSMKRASTVRSRRARANR